MEFDITGNLDINTQNAEQKLTNLANAIPGMSGSVAGSIATENATNNMTDFNGTVQSLNDAMKNVISNFKVFSDQVKNQNTNYGNIANSDVSGANSIFKQALGGNGISRVISGVGMAATYYDATERAKQQMLMGDWLGADISKTRAIGSGLSAIGGTMMGLTMIPGVGPVLGLTGAAFALGGMATNAIASHKETQKTEADLYSDSFGVKDSLLIGYGDRKATARNDYQTNQAIADKLYASIVARNFDTGMSDNDYATIVASMRRNGIKDTNTASDYVNRAANISRTTGTDVNSVASLMGLITRYGGNGMDSMNYAFGNARKAGFDDTQFDELLMGIQSAMEDGISKGFIVSSKDIVDTLTMLNSTSGNSAFWNGKEGLNRVQQMRSGMANAVNLNSVNDSLLWQSVMETYDDAGMKKALGDSYIQGNQISNVKAILEQGNLSPEFLQNYTKKLLGQYGNNADAITTNLMKLGLSQASANQLYNQIGNIGSYTDNLPNAVREGGMKTGTTEVMNYKNALNRESTLNTDNLQKLLGDVTYKVTLVNSSEKKNVVGTSGDWNVDSRILESEAKRNNASMQEETAYGYSQVLLNSKDISEDEYRKFMTDVAGSVVGNNMNQGLIFDVNKLQTVLDNWCNFMENKGIALSDSLNVYMSMNDY